MQTRLVATAAVFVALMMAAPAFAQRQGGQRQGGGFGGFGGFGGRGADALSLVQIPQVQEKLELTDEQKQQIQQLVEARRNQPRPDFGDFRNLSEEQRRERFTQMREEGEKRNAEVRAKLKEILVGPQNVVLDQLVIQRQGLAALLNPEVAQKLSLSAEQQEKIRTTMDENGQRIREAFGNSQGGDREAARARMEQLQKENEDKVLAHLTDAQKQQFTELKGEPFEFPRPQFGQGGGRRGEGQDGQGGQRGQRGQRGGGRPQQDNQ